MGASGQRATGEVRRAADKKLGLGHAMEMLRDGLTALEMAGRCLREAKVAVLLKHAGS